MRAVSLGLFLILTTRAFSQDGSSCTTDPAVANQITNTAAGVSSYYSGYSFVTVTGLNMPTPGGAISVGPDGVLPATVAGATVLVNGIQGFIFSFTSQQMMLLLPYMYGCTSLAIQANGITQFQAQIFLQRSAPGLFTNPGSSNAGQTVIASHSDWSLITSTKPARSGESITLWAAGLGLISPFYTSNGAQFIVNTAAEILDKSHFQVLFNGVAINPALITYVGVAPGFAGLYQINLTLPANLPPNPQIQLSTAEGLSPAGRYLNLQ
jgi:uncharacterized protein (TIGR03437 family)